MSENDDSAGRAAEEPREEESGKGPLRIWIAVSLAAIAVVGAGIGILQTDASTNESNTARETTRTAVGALRAGVIEDAALLLEEDIDAESDALLRERAFVAGEAGAAEPLSFVELRDIIPEGSDLPGARTREALRELSFDSQRLALRQAALAETRVTWNDRSTQYTTAIAVLAVALVPRRLLACPCGQTAPGVLCARGRGRARDHRRDRLHRPTRYPRDAG